MSMKLDTQVRKVCVVLNFKNEDQIHKVCERLDAFSRNGILYYGIIHDKDIASENKETGEVTYKTKHMHLVLNNSKFKRGSTWINCICDYLGLKSEQVSIEQCNDLIASIQYLIHQNDSDKAQYDYHDIKTNDSIDSLYDILSQKSYKSELTVDYLIGLYNVTGGDKLLLIKTIGIGKYNTMYRAINDVWEMCRRKEQVDLTRGEMERVIEENTPIPLKEDELPF